MNLARWKFELRAACLQVALDAQPFDEWEYPAGGVWAQFFRSENGAYRVRFPGLADFLVSVSSDRVPVWPVPNVSSSDVQELWLNQVVPLLRSLQGELVFHASAVKVDQTAVVFLGPSGVGKSTLAASFAAAGMPFLTDDVLLLDPIDCGYRVLPYEPSIHLSGENIAALIREGMSIAPPVEGGSEVRFLGGKHGVFCEHPCRLHRIYFMDECAWPDKPVFEKLRPAQVMTKLMQHSFLLGLPEPALIAAQFDELARMAELPLFFRLDYPRQYDKRHLVREAIVHHARDEGDSR